MVVRSPQLCPFTAVTRAVDSLLLPVCVLGVTDTNAFLLRPSGRSTSAAMLGAWQSGSVTGSWQH